MPLIDSSSEILASDQATALAYATPASGAVVVPVTNFGVFDTQRDTVAVNTSIGAWRKLDRIRRNPQVALAFHTREHSLTERPEYVLLQGRAELSPFEDRDGWLEVFGDSWERFSGQPREVGWFWAWWLSVYHWRVTIRVHVERAVTWPDLACQGEPVVKGPPLVAPEPQSEPRGGTGPRVSAARAARRAARLPNVLLGWIGGDGFPVVVPVEVAGAGPAGISLREPAGLVPGGGRRAGLTAHWFSRQVVGQIQRVHTGWLEGDPAGGRLLYAPHTKAAYRIPTLRLAFNIGAGFETRRRLRVARRRGVLFAGL